MPFIAFNPNWVSLNVGHAVDYCFVVAAFDIEKAKGSARTVSANGFLILSGSDYDSGTVTPLGSFD